MVEFHNCVSSLLDAFAHGIGIIKVQRRRRKEERIAIDSDQKSAETKLSKSLKRSRLHVKNAYDRDLSRHGQKFAVGDVEAHSALSAILFRLNAGFVSVIERFSRGRSSRADYQALVNLSVASRIEAIQAFEQLSQRLSKSSLDLVPANNHSTSPSRHRGGHKRKDRKDSSTASFSSRNTRSKSAPELSLTALGPATTEGWVRPKPGRKCRSASITKVASSTSSSPKRTGHRARPAPPARAHTTPAAPQKAIMPAVPPPQAPSPASRARPGDRKSFMSFASGSTKIGEIPEHKWLRPSMFETETIQFPVTAYYPMQPYHEPEKPRSRLMKLFRR
ncbi:hypothetical protein BP6252_02181 [Coleophoma cylindrospora]|uniref:Uncharacterized protein n=1 Tax=Coleophoma cylindrospora TaxID=1849047 RepID=A0A3D8SEH4_9HELO|nr:hypothetical protein BP6252_02181 [Coleophoma cylindrospora]